VGVRVGSTASAAAWAGAGVAVEGLWARPSAIVALAVANGTSVAAATARLVDSSPPDLTSRTPSAVAASAPAPTPASGGGAVDAIRAFDLASASRSAESTLQIQTWQVVRHLPGPATWRAPAPARQLSRTDPQADVPAP